MAKPITTIQKQMVTEEEKREKTIEELKASLTEKEKAVHELLSIVEELHKSGLLEAANAMLKAREDIAKIVIGQANRKPVTTMITHVIGIAQLFANLDPQLTSKLLESTASGFAEAYKQTKETGKKIGIFDLLKAINDPDINRAIRFILSSLKEIGKRLHDDKS
ncbi:helical membrane plugin domain-containing protein [Saccharococcus caldoxylosilyticus]|uniref:DUF1641 domain-containing protein n=1 Tax=Saccharococcus caldoxylosilyticus TaxID=81408 RepID=UPI001FCA9797|nr:DUF1641 domain-containing protein [Parageobacillus caldoxylosilyticus]BDG34530.1 hypothetical protein PcaKH15_04360 [Parageobacillus caldoxylosilyticus]BDG38302.1 hypothetical protein PcaKH16_04410 [Parageobacillus caldoxylosilyticus]